RAPLVTGVQTCALPISTKKIPFAESTSAIQSSPLLPVSGMSTCTPLPPIIAMPTTKLAVVSTPQIPPIVVRLRLRTRRDHPPCTKVESTAVRLADEVDRLLGELETA